MQELNTVTRLDGRRRKHFLYSLCSVAGLSLGVPVSAANLVIDSGAGTDERGALFNVDSAGSRTLVSDFGKSSQGPLGTNPVAVVVGPTGEILVADLDAGTDSRGALFSVNPGSGNRALASDFGDAAKGPLGEDPVNLAISSSGEIIVVDLDAGEGFNGALFSVNPVNGNRALVSDFGKAAQGPLGVFPLAVAFDASGQLFVTVLSAGPEGNGVLFAVDPANGTRTLVSDFGNSAQGPLGEIPYGVTINAAGELLVVDEDAGTNFRGAIFKVNPATGNRTLLSDFNQASQGPLGEDPTNLALTVAGDILVADFTAGANLQGSLFRVNALTGKRALVSDFSDAAKGPQGLTPFGVAVVPEIITPGSLQFGAAGYNIVENGGSATIIVNRTGGQDGTVSVGYTTTGGGTATEGADYAFTEGVLVLTDGVAVSTFSVPITDDHDVESGETVNLALMNPDGGAVLGANKTTVLTIANDDVITPAVCDGLIATIVGAGANDTLNGTAGPDVIHGRGGNDIIRGYGGADIICGGWGDDQLYGADGDDRLFASNGDDQLFGEEGVDNLDGGEGIDRCELGLPVSGNTANGCETVIRPAPGILQFNTATYEAAESGGNVKIVVTRMGGSDGAISVEYKAFAGSAAPDSDFTAASGTLTFAAGDTTAKSANVHIVNDQSVEKNETVRLSLTGPTGGATLGPPSAALLIIVDDDQPVVVCDGQVATIVGTAKSETINGTAGRDIIQASGGNDIVRGNGGDDLICGGAGDDQLFGQRGNDRLGGGEDFDRCDGGPDTARDQAFRCERVTAVP